MGFLFADDGTLKTEHMAAGRLMEASDMEPIAVVGGIFILWKNFPTYVLRSLCVGGWMLMWKWG